MSGDVTGRGDEGLAEVLWTASRADESTISATGANHVAAAILASDWLARVKREAAAAAEVRVLRETADRLSDFEFPAGSDALEPMYRLVIDLRRKAARVEEARDADHA